MDEVKLEHRLSNVEERAKSNSRRLDNLEKQHGEMSDLVKSMAAIAQKQEDMEEDVREVKSDIKSLLAVPAGHWRTVITAAITAVVGAIAGAIIALVVK